jgi:hypothetical protein
MRRFVSARDPLTPLLTKDVLSLRWIIFNGVTIAGRSGGFRGGSVRPDHPTKLRDLAPAADEPAEPGADQAAGDG